MAFYEKISPVFQGVIQPIPPPSLCPECRLQRRLAFRNQIYVYQRPSSVTGHTIFSRFPAEVPFPVVENTWWYSDAWDACSYGRKTDCSQPFFPQLQALRDVVPHRTLSLHQAENCDYCNNATGIKNCYLVFNTTGTEDSLYCENCTWAKDCIDCTFCPGSELCWDCTRCERCYHLRSSTFCEDCSESAYLTHCYSCKHCFGCINLSHKEFCIFNEQKTEAEYTAFLQSFPSTSWQAHRETVEHCQQLWLNQPRPHSIIHTSEHATGNNILGSKNVTDCFFVEDCEDSRFCFGLYGPVRSCMDFSFFGKKAELLYEVTQCGIGDSRVLFCMDCWDGNSDLLYCWMCQGCQDCFGCVGLQKKKYCILNVQYTQEEYEALVPQIIATMRKTGEFGEFFPLSFSPFPYNKTVAQTYFPLSQQETEAQGLTWYAQESEDNAKAIDASALPDGHPVSDDSLIVRSEQSGKAFRITEQEIKRYRALSTPLPRTTYDERMEERIRILGGIRLYNRTCAKTGKPILTTYPPETPFPIWDREEYIQEFRG